MPVLGSILGSTMGAGISDAGAADSARAVVLRGGLDLAVTLREPGLLAPEPRVPDVLRVPELRVPLRELVLRVPVLRVPVLRARVPVLRAREVVPRDVVLRDPLLLDVPRVPPERDVVLLVLRPVAGADVVMALAAAFIARDASVIALVAVVMAFVMAVMALAEEVALVATDLILVAADLASLAALVTLVAAALELRLCAADVRLVPERLVPLLDLLVLARLVPDRLVPDRLDELARLVVPVDLDEVPVLRRTVVRGAVAVCAALVVFLAFLVPVVRAAVPRPDAVRDVLCVGTDLPPRDDQLRGDYSTDRDGLHTFRRSRIRPPPDARPS